jgi:hypothetical protein
MLSRLRMVTGTPPIEGGQSLAEAEHVVIRAEGEAGTCEVKLTFAETERFEEALDKARKRVGLRIEKRRSHEAMKVDRVEDEDFEEAE